jgi:ribosomal protein L31
MLKRKKLLLTLLVCAAMTVLAAPLVVSIVNNEAPVLPDETTASTSSVTDYQNSSITEVVSTESTGNSYMPSLIVDSNGNIHVTWHDNTDYAGAGTDADIFYKRYELGVENWTTTEVVSTESTAGSYSPSLAVDSDGNIHIAWHDRTDYAGSETDDDIFYKRYEVGVGWSTTEVISTESTDTSSHTSLTVDSNGNIHVASSPAPPLPSSLIAAFCTQP